MYVCAPVCVYHFWRKYENGMWKIEKSKMKILSWRSAWKIFRLKKKIDRDTKINSTFSKIYKKNQNLQNLEIFENIENIEKPWKSQKTQKYRKFSKSWNLEKS